MLLIHAVKRALDQNRTFDVETEILRPCGNFDELIDYLPILFKRVDDTLFHGALLRFFEKHDIPLHIVASVSNAVSGLTTYDVLQGMKIHIHQKAWVEHFPAMVGGTLCHRADTCLIKVFLHEMIHVLLFAIYLELDFSPSEVQSSFVAHSDPTHNILFTEWLRRFFGQDTIDNSLLLHMKHPEKEPVTFTHTVPEIERTCLVSRNNNNLEVYHDGQWQPCKLAKDDHTVQKPHHSRIIVKKKIIVVPNGLLRCS